MARYYLGQVVRGRYRDAPIPKKDRYPIGTIVTIYDDNTHREFAKYIVAWTDTTIVTGFIIEIAGIPSKQCVRT